jgi:4-hydroxy-4-methyl-2-oxoglutarate aldolase
MSETFSSATVYEAAQSVLVDPEIAVDPRIGPAWVGAALAGPAFTVQGAHGDNLALHRAVATAPAGHVLVVDVGGAAFGHWGEVLAVAARHRGIAGVVIDGGVRDTGELQALGFPVFSRNNSIRGTRKHFPGEFGVAVRISGVTVHPGDFVVGDADGVAVVAAQHTESVLTAARKREAHEREIWSAVQSGATTLELYGLGGRP